MSMLVLETKITKKGRHDTYQTAVPKVIIKLFNHPRKIRWMVDFKENRVYVEFIKEEEKDG